MTENGIGADIIYFILNVFLLNDLTIFYLLIIESIFFLITGGRR